MKAWVVADLESVVSDTGLCGSQREKEVILENKRQVQHLVNKSKSIVRLKPRNPHEKSSSPVIVKALCDFKQDQVWHTCAHTHTLR